MKVKARMRNIGSVQNKDFSVKVCVERQSSVLPCNFAKQAALSHPVWIHAEWRGRFDGHAVHQIWWSLLHLNEKNNTTLPSVRVDSLFTSSTSMQGLLKIANSKKRITINYFTLPLINKNAITMLQTALIGTFQTDKIYVLHTAWKYNTNPSAALLENPHKHCNNFT